uniref:Receptor tyrosine-protein kinase erbB-2 n=1 Tax=Zeugodacus cucurbitae TaxID=28588 RepID=A0A0A1XCN4_ZEUCU
MKKVNYKYKKNIHTYVSVEQIVFVSALELILRKLKKKVPKKMHTKHYDCFVNSNMMLQQTERPPIIEFRAKRKVSRGRESNSVRNCVVSRKRVGISAPLHVTFLILLCTTYFDLAKARAAGTDTAATADGAITSHANHKQHHRNAMQYVHNNFTHLSERSAVDFIAEKGGISAGSSMSDVAVTLAARTPDARTNAGCPPTTSSHCLRCNSEGCIKCPAYLMTDTRQCVDQCPSGYIDQWSAHTEFMGRVCVSTGYSGPLMAAIAGLIGGFVVCLTLLAVAMMLVRRRRRRKSIKQKLINENTMDRSDFLRQLNEMRPNAEYFLAMLNDTRRQIRKLYLSGEVGAANSYRPIVRDLAKILILLNRPIELIPAAPHDWNRLYTWSEQALERYKPQVGHLIDFFQPSGGGGGGRGSSSVGITDDFDATFFPQKSNVYRQSMLAGTGQQKLHMFGSLISLHEFEEPRPSDPFGSSFNTLKSGNLISDLNASSLWLEDEFYKLGFRPQDEITTEL